MARRGRIRRPVSPNFSTIKRREHASVEHECRGVSIFLLLLIVDSEHRRSISAKLTGFYIIFYCFLAAFWIGCLAVFLSTVDKKLPRYYGKGTIIGSNPGLFLVASAGF